MENNLTSKRVKENIKLLIENGNLKEASCLIQEYRKLVPLDIEIYSITAIILIMQQNFSKAEKILLEGSEIEPNDFDINFNLGYVYKEKNMLKKAYKYYSLAIAYCTDKRLKEEIDEIIRNIELEYGTKLDVDIKRLVVFVQQGLDTFIDDILNSLSYEYEVKKIIATNSKQIDEGMEWADICWFEWCDQLVAYGSGNNISSQKIIICRLHSYEAFTDYPSKVKWDNVDKLIVVASHIKDFIIENFKIEKGKIEVIPNGIDINKWTFNKRQFGFKIAYAGYLNYKKGSMLLLHTFKAIFDKDNRYKLYIAGKFEDDRDILYFRQMIKEFGLENSIIFEGWQGNLNEWFEDKNTIICTSILESQNISVMQAMAKGIKPIIHNFVGAKGIYPEEYIWNTIEDAVCMINEKNYNSIEYRKYIEDKYSYAKQINTIKKCIIELIEKNNVKNFELGKDIIKNINYKNKNEELTVQYIINLFNKFISYSKENFDNYDFTLAKVLLGKREKINEDYEMIEFIIKNINNQMLVINNIWFNYKNSDLIIPEVILGSRNMHIIKGIIHEVLNYNLQYNNNIAGFVFQEDILKDMNENYLAYIWERAMPASHFMPTLGYIRIAEKYIFAGTFISKKDKVLEAPCGFGYGAAYFSKLCASVNALDIAEDNIDFSRKAYDFNNIKWTKGDVTKLEYRNNEFDVYVSYEVFEHLPLESVEQYLQEANRVVKLGGKFIISTPNKETRENVNNPFHIKEYYFEEFDKLLKKFFNQIQYYSVWNFKVEEGFNKNAVNMLAVCSK